MSKEKPESTPKRNVTNSSIYSKEVQDSVLRDSHEQQEILDKGHRRGE